MDKTYFAEIMWLVSNVHRSKCLVIVLFVELEVRVVVHPVRGCEWTWSWKKFSNLLKYFLSLISFSCINMNTKRFTRNKVFQFSKTLFFLFLFLVSLQGSIFFGLSFLSFDELLSEHFIFCFIFISHQCSVLFYFVSKLFGSNIS